jgi:hypothetical protein
MGMFDTIIFENPIKCEICGALIESTQTKEFECMMETYYIGDIVRSSTITGIIKEELYCDNFQNHPDYIESKKELEEKEKNAETEEEKNEISIIQFKIQSIFLVLWQRILIGIEEDYEKAEDLLKSVNILQLAELYQKIYDEMVENSQQREEIIAFGKYYFDFINLDSTEQEKVRNKDDKWEYFSYWRILPYLDDEKPFHKFVAEFKGKSKKHRSFLLF